MLDNNGKDFWKPRPVALRLLFSNLWAEKCNDCTISTLTPRSTCLSLWSLKRDQKIKLDIPEQHRKQKNHRHHLRKLKLNVHSARKLIHTTKPCKDTFGISILGKWRLPYPRVDISREPVLISKGPLYDKPYLFRGCVYIPFIASTSPVHHTIPNKYPAHASWMNAWTLLE